MAQKVTSTDIKLALKEFHNGKPSYFITECKTCSTYFPDPQGLLKFDGLAITKSYTKKHGFLYCTYFDLISPNRSQCIRYWGVKPKKKRGKSK